MQNATALTSRSITKIAGSARNRAAYKLTSDFDPENRDENVDYYVAKLDELVKKSGGVTAAAFAPKQESIPL